jgi:hypothetical protein
VIGPNTPVHGMSFQDTALSADDAEDQVDQLGKCLDLRDPSGASIVDAVKTPETVLSSLQQKYKKMFYIIMIENLC